MSTDHSKQQRVDTQSGNTIAEQLGYWVAGLSLDQVPGEAVQIARRCIVDTIGVVIAGSATPVAKGLRAHVIMQYGPGDCDLLGPFHDASGADAAGTDATGPGVSALGAALANGVAAHALDFDDTSYAGVIHGSAVILPAVLSASQQVEGTGADFLNAFIAGSEVSYALGLTLSDSHYMRGWFATGTVGAIGAAAGAAKALGLNGKEISAAIALAAIQTNGMRAMMGFDAKPMLAGQAAKLGVESALLAAQGHSIPPAAFESDRGLLNLMNGGRRDAIGLGELGATWRLLDPGIAVKKYPVCSGAHAAIAATQLLIVKSNLDRSKIKTVDCEVSHLVNISLVHHRPTTPTAAQFSMPFAIGCILAFGQLGPEQINLDTLADKTLQHMMTKVTMVEADDLNGPEFQPQNPECARATITMVDGETHTDVIGAQPGMPSNPLPDSELSEKFRACTAYAGWPPGQSETLLERLWNINRVDNVRSLMHGAV